MAKVKIQKKDIWIDMTPMSDVMTLLLCFFMLTSTFLTPEPIQVTTPNSVSEVKIPESDVLNILVSPEGRIYVGTEILNILVSPEGRIYVGTENKNNMQAMLDAVTDKFGITLNATQIKHFREDAMIGAPLSKMAEYLSLEPEKMAEVVQSLGKSLVNTSPGKNAFIMPSFFILDSEVIAACLDLLDAPVDP